MIPKQVTYTLALCGFFPHCVKKLSSFDFVYHEMLLMWVLQPDGGEGTCTYLSVMANLLGAMRHKGSSYLGVYILDLVIPIHNRLFPYLREGDNEGDYCRRDIWVSYVRRRIVKKTRRTKGVTLENEG